MKSTMQDVPAHDRLDAAARHHRARGLRGRHRDRGRHAQPDVRRASGGAPPGWRNGLRGLGITGDQRVGDVPVEQRRAPRGLPRGPVDGRGAAHAQHPALPRAAGLHRQPRRGPGRHRRRLAGRPARQAAAAARDRQHVLVAGPDAAYGRPRLAARGGQGGARSTRTCWPSSRRQFDWPEVDERDAAAMCYTSGTTGNPKGVVYSHRSAYLHSMAVSTGIVGGHRPGHDRVLPIVPMFHANAWGLAYAALMTGASLCMPDRWLQAEPLCRFMQESRPTVSGAVPTVWNDVLGYLDEHPDVDARLDCGWSSAAAPPSRSSLQKALAGAARHLRCVQAWGMTETSPVASAGAAAARRRGRGRVALPRRPGPAAAAASRAASSATTATTLPRDGEAVGELEVRGPWVTGGYYNGRRPRGRREVPRRLAAHRRRRHPRRARLHHADRPGQGRDQVRRRVDLLGRPRERPDGATPTCVEAAVVGIPDEKWQERPLASVVLREGATRDGRASCASSSARSFAKWQLPDAWAFIDAGAAHLGRQVRQEGDPPASSPRARYDDPASPADRSGQRPGPPATELGASDASDDQALR